MSHTTKIIFILPGSQPVPITRSTAVLLFHTGVASSPGVSPPIGNTGRMQGLIHASGHTTNSFEAQEVPVQDARIYSEPEDI